MRFFCVLVECAETETGNYVMIRAVFRTQSAFSRRGKQTKSNYAKYKKIRSQIEMQCLRLSWRICLTVFFIILLQRRLAMRINLSYDNQLMNIKKIASREMQISSRATRVASRERKIMSRETRIASRETRVASHETRISSRKTRYATVKLPLSSTVALSLRSAVRTKV